MTPDEIQQLHNELSKMERAAARFKIRGQGISGNFGDGYAHKPQSFANPVGTMPRGGDVSPSPPPVTGACCKDGSCSIDTPTHCTTSGGTYQGDGTACADVNCGTATSGACCTGAVCSVLSPADCAVFGGIYQGDGVPCSPGLCGAGYPCCGCGGWLAFDGSGREFLTSVTENVSHAHHFDCSQYNNYDYHRTITESVDPITCEDTLIQTCSGSSDYLVGGTGYCCHIVDDDCTCQTCPGTGMIPCPNIYGPCNVEFVTCGNDYHGEPPVTTATVHHTSAVADDLLADCVQCDGYRHTTQTLSDECNPEC